MSVVGIDVGNHASCAAICRRAGVDLVLNKESSRETPSCVCFTDRQRLSGTDAAARQSLAPANTVDQLKRLLGRSFADVQAELPRLPFSVSAGPDGRCQVNVTYCGEPASFSTEQLMAMVLVDQKKLAGAEAGVTVVDCVLSVPASYTEAQRLAMLNAASIAGLNCLRLINENTATALAYGLYKTDMPEAEPGTHVAFVDVGHSQAQVSVVAFRKSGMTVKLHAFDSDLGGRNFDELVFDKFCADIKEKHKIDIKSNKKAAFKLRTASEKVKKMLSANAEAPYNIECIMEDVDVKGSMKREELEELSQPLIQRFRALLESAIAKSGVPVESFAAVEVVGSSTRTPALVKTVEDVFKKIASRTLNAKEIVAKGAALQCAMLSPVFKVRDYDIIDACPYSLELQWDKDGEPASTNIFEAGAAFPNAKMLTLLRTKPFTIHAFTGETKTPLADYEVGPFEVPAGAEKAKLKAKVRMNLHGLSSIESLQAIEEEAAAPEEAKDVSMEEAGSGAAAAAANSAPPTEGDGAAAAAAAAADAAANGGPAPMDTDAAAAPAADKKAPAAADKAAEKKRRTKKHDVPVITKLHNALDKKQVEAYFEQEAQMAANDKLQEETADRKNALEGYILGLRNKLYDQLAPYVKEADRGPLIEVLQKAEDWLYEEGEDVTKSVYAAKLEELKQLGDPIQGRFAEEQARPAACEALKACAEGYLAFAANTSPQYAHITAEERESVAKEAQAALSWLGEKTALQGSLAKHDEPVLRSEDCLKKRDTVERVCRPIAVKPAPKPAPPPPAPTPPTPPPEQAAPADGAAPMEEEPAVGPEAPAQEQQQPEPTVEEPAA